MQCRVITSEEFDTIAAELAEVDRWDGSIEIVSGLHADLGMTVLVRDATRCVVLADGAALDVTIQARWKQ